MTGTADRYGADPAALEAAYLEAAAGGRDALTGALRNHLRTIDAHARYIAGVDLDGMTLAQLIAEHDDHPAHVQSCWDYPSNYR
jgi:hypothetical protein